MFGTPVLIRPSANVKVGVVGPKGTSVVGAARAPLATDGFDGDFFVALVSGDVRLYGPKVAGAWPTSYLSLTGPQGAPGPQILSGGGAPTSGIGNNNDYYIDFSNIVLYGPKTTGAWPTPGISLVGGPGSPGPASTLTIPAGGVTALAPGSTPTVTITGSAPSQNIAFGIPVGTVIRSTSGAPAGSLGVNGDYAVDSGAGVLYGPKAAGAWPSGLSLIGPPGPSGSGTGNVIGPSSGSVAAAQLAGFTDSTGTRIRGTSLTEAGALTASNALSEVAPAAARANLSVQSRARTFFLSQS